MHFSFATSGRIIFGPGTLDTLAPLAAGYGRTALVVTGGNDDRADLVLNRLRDQDLAACRFTVAGEPTTETVRRGAALAGSVACDMVIGFGGGSVLDAAKAIAAMRANPGDPLDYLEVIGAGRELARPAVPTIAIPTTAGTGAEVTANAVLGSPEHRVKVSLRSPFMLPRVALVDPLLTHSMPPAVTAATGLDALTQVLEPLVSPHGSPLTDGFCREGLRRGARSLRTAFRDGGNGDAREDMALASLLGGLALANAKLGAVHGIAGPLGGMIDAPHGALCAALLPHVMAANIDALRRLGPSHRSLGRYREAAALLTGSPDATPEQGVEWVRGLCRDLAIPSLATQGLRADMVPDLADKAARASSMRGNPVQLDSRELQAVICNAMA